METQSDLQHWQKQILDIEGLARMEYYLEPQQRMMIEKLLSNGFYISGEERIKETLEKVLLWNAYGEEDRAVLNYVRKCFLEGKNWIK